MTSSTALDAAITRAADPAVRAVVLTGTGTVKVTVAIPLQEGLRPGMYVQVELVTDTHEDAVLLPKRAVVYDNDQMFVFRLGDERRVERLEVEARLETPDTIEPDGGLAAGDQVVVEIEGIGMLSSPVIDGRGPKVAAA